MKQCWIFHDWLYLGQIEIVAPVLGPFDPRTDKQRTETREKYVCVRCGKGKITEIGFKKREPKP